MKILSFNIRSFNQNKIDKIISMGADVIVLPECYENSSVELPEGYSMEWFGNKEESKKGLGVIWRNEHEVVVAPWFNDQHLFILPLIVDRRFLLFAAWPTIFDKQKKVLSSDSFGGSKGV